MSGATVRADLGMLLAPDRNDSTPMYLQIAMRLRELIGAGRMTSDQGLPSERQLVDLLGVSRGTARKTLEQVMAWGLAVRRHGSGTYVAPHLDQPLSRLSCFSEEVQSRGMQSGSIWLFRDVALCSSEELMHLGLQVGDKVARLKRLRTADGVVMAIEYCRLPLAYLPDPGVIEDSLYDYLDQRGTPVVSALQKIGAFNANAEQAQLLGIAVNTAVLFITRLGYDAMRQRMELTHSYCRPDYYDFVAELSRKSPHL